MENNNINLENLDTGLADESTTKEAAIPVDDMLTNLGGVENEMDLTSEKIQELNKKLPSWSLEPPHSFVK